MGELLHEELTSPLNAAMEFHSQLGPGLPESVYESGPAFELSQRGLKFARQMPVPVLYKGNLLDCGFRLDLLVKQAVLVELKHVVSLAPIHEAQLFTNMRLLN